MANTTEHLVDPAMVTDQATLPALSAADADHYFVLLPERYSLDAEENGL